MTVLWAKMLRSALIYGLFLSQSSAVQHILAPSPAQELPPGLLNSMRLYSEYTAAATCPSNFNSPGYTKVVCEPGVCPMLEKTQATVLMGFTNWTPGNTTGYLAVDHTNHVLVLAFRGSRTKGNIQVDGQYEQVSIPWICQGCQVHYGFYSSWDAISQYLLSAVRRYYSVYHYPIVFTGHSLGGALAALGAVLEDWPTYTYGAPELGNYAFANFTTNAIGAQGTKGFEVRVTHTNDPVPKVLSRDEHISKYWQYSTTSPEFWITSKNHVPVSKDDIEVFYGIDNMNGNLGTKTSDPFAHNWYFGDMAGCTGD
ncbi:Alpha/Beta hydrolase protein [Aspergillus pseudocaelatus]|uniref:feruloyl esterase n=1 Tax=Aspergillus pseudocaelatus TaxID=1825620 RepID=A0ABQ6W1L5_9EURO|nr:Alpha/Beta hydrolase protein [Aspergillus pseudocaelatus]